MNKTTVIHHSADYDGIFCREIARRFIHPDNNIEFIGWDFADKPLPIPIEGEIYVMDLPVDRVFGFDYKNELANGVTSDFRENPIQTLEQRIIWIDHHKSSIETHPSSIRGYRIDGVSACRLAWQWFVTAINHPFDGMELYLPGKERFIERRVTEPLAVRLAGEYDVWDHRGDGDLEFQFGLDCFVQDEKFFAGIIDNESQVKLAIDYGSAAMACYAKRDADVMRTRSFLTEFDGLKFLCLNTARCNSNTFAALDVPETGHDALMAIYWNGRKWSVSMYHAKHRKDIDLSMIAVEHGGGGHRGACGFTTPELKLTAFKK